MWLYHHMINHQWRFFGKKVLLGMMVLSFACLVPTWIVAKTQDLYPFASREQQQQFYLLLKKMRCLVCQNQDLADSNAPLAQDLRQQVYSMLRAGQSSQDVQNYMTSRYSDFILFKPPLVTRTYILWFMPIGLLVAGGIIIIYLLQSAKHSLC